jgi:lipid A 3-O-deacylase
MIALAWLTAFGLTSHVFAAEEPVSRPTAGTQTVGITTGPFYPIRLLSGQSSKLFGFAAMPSWSIALTDAIGSGWYQGQVAAGVELVSFRTSDPISATGIGLAPKLAYTLTSLGRVRPFVEGGGGPLWTDLGGRLPEQPGQFNFIVWGSAGCAWLFDASWAVQAGYRFVHISNAGTREPNSGLNVGMPFLGLSYAFSSRGR